MNYCINCGEILDDDDPSQGGYCNDCADRQIADDDFLLSMSNSSSGFKTPSSGSRLSLIHI